MNHTTMIFQSNLDLSLVTFNFNLSCVKEFSIVLDR